MDPIHKYSGGRQRHLFWRLEGVDCCIGLTLTSCAQHLCRMIKGGQLSLCCILASWLVDSGWAHPSRKPMLTTAIVVYNMLFTLSPTMFPLRWILCGHVCPPHQQHWQCQEDTRAHIISDAPFGFTRWMAANRGRPTPTNKRQPLASSRLPHSRSADISPRLSVSDRRSTEPDSGPSDHQLTPREVLASARP